MKTSFITSGPSLYYTHLVSSCIKFVSTPWSLSSGSFCSLTALEGAGLSGGFGCVNVNGNSTAKSLKNVLVFL